MTKEQAVVYLRFSGFSEEQIKAIEGALSGWGSCVSDNPQKPICPSAGVDCEDCPAYEDTISRKAVLDTLERMDRALDEDRTVESYKELLRECYKVLPSVTPKPKVGHWIDDGQYAEGHSEHACRCSKCGYTYIGYTDKYKECPNCGAKMAEGSEE